jgi:hypothetical protein
MKKIIYILVVFLCVGCDSENAFNCIKKEGTIIRSEFSVSSFDKITVFERVQLFIEEGDEQRVIVETEENLLSDIEIYVEDGTLMIFDNSACNLIRDYGITKVFVTTPNISEIRNSSGLTIESIGLLRFSKLVLLSEEQIGSDEYHTDGDFNLNLDVDDLKIVSNGISNFYLKGTVNYARINLYAGDSRVEAENLIINELTIYHRSSNKMIVNPQVAIRGEIRGYGDVISKNRPPIVEVEEFYTGSLIFDE